MSLSLRSTAVFVPRVACYSTASYSTTMHEVEKSSGNKPQTDYEGQSNAGRSTKPEVGISTDSDQVESTGGHVRV